MGLFHLREPSPPDGIVMWCLYITLENYFTSGLSKSNFKDHYGDAVIKQCQGKIAEINEFSAFDEMLWVTRQTGRQQVDGSKVEGRQ